MGALVEAAFGDGQDLPPARRSGPKQLAVARVGREVHTVAEADATVPKRKGRREEQLAGRQVQLEGAALALPVGHQQPARFPFRMLAQHQAARVARRVAALVVEPHGQARLLRRADGADKGVPLGVALEVLVERNVAHHPAESLPLQPLDQGVLRLGPVRPAVDDLKNAGFGRRMSEPPGKRGRRR